MTQAMKPTISTTKTTVDMNATVSTERGAASLDGGFEPVGVDMSCGCMMEISRCGNSDTLMGRLATTPQACAANADSSLSLLQRVAQPGGAFVILFGDRLLQLFLQRRVNVMLLPEHCFQMTQMANHPVRLHFILALVGGEKFADAFQTQTDLVNRLFWRVVLLLHFRRRLRALKEHKAAVLLV